MKWSESLGMLLLGIWLILVGILSLFNIHIALFSRLLPLLMIVAGVLIILGSAKAPKGLGMWFLAIYLILRGLAPFISGIPYLGYLLDLLAILAGIFILLKK